ncbi:hypothetical protein CDAR_465341 [Caerostris darwini]|uniref:LAGLIDADG homing endonuclease n=1 Tax=Caerostris darwini TaxID=1538125 RepID=A0AAV4SJP3_9ARAC|nr:hypothetical protein CDAR_465341 [Caerostris darwini]
MVEEVLNLSANGGNITNNLMKIWNLIGYYDSCIAKLSIWDKRDKQQTRFPGLARFSWRDTSRDPHIAYLSGFGKRGNLDSRKLARKS